MPTEARKQESLLLQNDSGSASARNVWSKTEDHTAKSTGLSAAIGLSSSFPWYDTWITEQIAHQPKDTFWILNDSPDNSSVIGHEQFLAIWSETRQILARGSSNSIDAIVGELLTKNLLRIDSEMDTASNDVPSHARYLVFAIIGWQTMLFKPDKLSYPKDYFGIVDETNGFRGRRHTLLFQPDSAYGKPLHVLLLGFGLMLPPKGFHTTASEDHEKSRITFNAKSFNAHLLTTICDIRVVWTDSLACHLEFDSSANMLYIFKYPSFCLANLDNGRNQSSSKTTIHACAKPTNSDALWASVEDVDAFLREVLISYRLLFGLEKVSRRCFRRQNPFLGTQQSTKDKMLEEICSRKRPNLSFSPIVYDNFDLDRDFPILRDRLSPLLRTLSKTKPRTLKQLWEDRRDSSAWSAFWIILLIGVSGLMLALIQVVLQIVQIALPSS